MGGEWDRRNFLKSVILSAGMPSFRSLRGSESVPSEAPLVAFRVATAHWMTDDCFQPLLDFFARHPAVVDELAFFTNVTHPPAPLNVLERRAQRLKEILPRVREHGMAAGINVLATMGHHEENLPNSLNEPWQRVMGPDGRTCLGSYCPAQPEFIDYARKLHSMMAQTNPDFIWIDDDVRLAGHKPVQFACFCDLCLRQFSEQVGQRYTRESLVAAFDGGSLDDRLRLRRAWLEHNRRVIDVLFRNIEGAVHEVKPGLPIGFMTGDRFYEGYGFERWAKTLSGPGRAPVRWRPGGGFYDDDRLLGLVEKASDLGRQVSALPLEVTTIESELENFPYQPLRKSRQTTVVEAAVHMAAGTTATAFNVLSMYQDPFDEYEPLYDRISQYRPYYRKLRSSLGRSMVTGVWPAWNHDVFSSVNPDGKWLAGSKLPFTSAYVLGEIGIPLCYHPGGGAATILAGSTVLAFSQEDLRRMFSGGVLMDGEAWLALKRLGLESWTGVKDLENVDHDATEVLSSHNLNGRFAGWSRDCRQSFWAERAYRLNVQARDVEILARMVDYAGRDLGPSMTAYSNELGGRVVVLGYFPWSQIHNLAKSSQLKSVCMWLSRDRLPAVSEAFAKVVIWCRQGRGERKCIVALNASLDPIEKLPLLVLSDDLNFTYTSPTVEPREISGERVVGPAGYVRIVLSDLAPWTSQLVVGGRL